MKRAITPPFLLLTGMLGFAICTSGQAAGDPALVTIQLPAETAQFMPGPGLETAQKNCVACHSADYIYMQPSLTKEQWRGTVMKMKNTFGAPIDVQDVDMLVNYLMSQNGKS